MQRTGRAKRRGGTTSDSMITSQSAGEPASVKASHLMAAGVASSVAPSIALRLERGFQRERASKWMPER